MFVWEYAIDRVQQNFLICGNYLKMAIFLHTYVSIGLLFLSQLYFDGLGQERYNSSVPATDLCLACTNTSILKFGLGI